MDAEQAEYTMVDGLGDKLEASEAADKHKPLNHMLDDVKKGSTKLEDAKVNVWGQPLSEMLPASFFDRQSEAMRKADGSKLKQAGISVDHESPFPDTSPKVGE